MAILIANQSVTAMNPDCTGGPEWYLERWKPRARGQRFGRATSWVLAIRERYHRGVQPVILTNVRVKCGWSAKPAFCAIVVIDSLPRASSPHAQAIRRRLRYSPIE